MRVNLPSGAWAEFKDEVTYGARRQMRRLSHRFTANLHLADQATQAQSVSISAEDLVDTTELETYWPLVYLMTAWSFTNPLPTLEDLSPLDDIPLKDGETLLELAQEKYNDSFLDTSPKAEGDPNPFDSSNGSGGDSKESLLTTATPFQPSTTSTD